MSTVTIPPGFHTRNDLRRLGWNDELLRKTPHTESTVGGTPCYLYAAEDVRTVEKRRAAQKATKAAQAVRDTELASVCLRIASRGYEAPVIGSGGFKAKNAARAAGYMSLSDMRATTPKQDAVPIKVKGEIFYGREKCEELISRTEAKRRGLFVAKNAEPAKRLAFNPGRRVVYDAFRASDCHATETIKPVSAGRRLLNLLHALPGEKIAVTSRGETIKIRDTGALCYPDEEVGFISQFDTQAPVTLVVRRELSDTFVRDDGVVLPYMVVNAWRVVGDQITALSTKEEWGDGVVFDEIEVTDAATKELADRWHAHRYPKTGLAIHPDDCCRLVGSIVDKVLSVICSLRGTKIISFATGEKYVVREKNNIEQPADQMVSFKSQFDQSVVAMTIRCTGSVYQTVYGLRVLFGEIEAVPADEMEKCHQTDADTGEALPPEEGVMFGDLTEQVDSNR